MKKNLAIGRAGELRVASELLLRGFEVFRPETDSGIDLVLSNGYRIQVKTSSGWKNKKNNFFSYSFGFQSWKKENRKYLPHDLAEVDCLILWPLSTDVFFIIPVSEVRGKRTIAFSLADKRNGGGLKSKYLRFKNNWDILQRKGR